MSKRLTERLLELEPELLERATKHPFLRDAGMRRLSQTELEAWLTQDRLYITCGYVPLIGALLQKIPETEQEPSHPSSTGFSDKLHILTGALTNIERELNFFEETAAENGLSLGVAPSSSEASSDSLLHHATRQYIWHINEVMKSVVSFKDAIILLWAMEIIYLKAWRYAASLRPTTTSTTAGPGMERAVNVLINNWTCPEFEEFVNQLGSLVDEIGANYTGADSLWIKTLHLELAFWRIARPSE